MAVPLRQSEEGDGIDQDGTDQAAVAALKDFMGTDEGRTDETSIEGLAQKGRRSSRALLKVPDCMLLDEPLSAAGPAVPG